MVRVQEEMGSPGKGYPAFVPNGGIQGWGIHHIRNNLHSYVTLRDTIRNYDTLSGLAISYASMASRSGLLGGSSVVLVKEGASTAAHCARRKKKHKSQSDPISDFSQSHRATHVYHGPRTSLRQLLEGDSQPLTRVPEALWEQDYSIMHWNTDTQHGSKERVYGLHRNTEIKSSSLP